MKNEKIINVVFNDIKKKISLSVLNKNIIRLRPYGVFDQTLTIPATVFAFDSSFPGNGILLHLYIIKDLADKHPDKMFMIFGHTDKQGSEVYNKHLSDKRAEAVESLLTKDYATFDKIALEENWDLKIYQALLRGIGCNPGAIDGKGGEMTSAAIRGFQTEYNEGFYSGSPPVEEIPVSGELTDETMTAVRHSYLDLYSPGISKGKFTSVPFGGCSEFNPVSDKADLNRRAVIAVASPDNQVINNIPCRKGDINACLLDNKGKMRCSFYRRYIKEEDEDPKIPRFFDFQWLKEKSGAAHLSALTFLPDDTTAKFSIYKSDKPLSIPPPHSEEGSSRPSFKDELGTAEGKISGGVCYARWMPPKDYDPFDYECWMINLDFEVEINSDADEEELDDGDPASTTSLYNNHLVEPPVFSIDAGGHWAYSQPPGKPLSRFRFINDPSVKGSALQGDGSIINFKASSYKPDTGDRSVILSVVVMGKDPDTENT